MVGLLVYKLAKSEGLAILLDATCHFSNRRYLYRLLSINQILENAFFISSELSLLFQYSNINFGNVLGTS